MSDKADELLTCGCHDENMRLSAEVNCVFTIHDAVCVPFRYLSQINRQIKLSNVVVVMNCKQMFVGPKIQMERSAF